VITSNWRTILRGCFQAPAIPAVDVTSDSQVGASESVSDLKTPGRIGCFFLKFKPQNFQKSPRSGDRSTDGLVIVGMKNYEAGNFFGVPDFDHTDHTQMISTDVSTRLWVMIHTGYWWHTDTDGFLI